MKKYIYIFLVGGALVAAALLLWWRVPAMPVRPGTPMDEFQGRVRLDRSETESVEQRRMMQRLRREEDRQRPGEGRN